MRTPNRSLATLVLVLSLAVPTTATAAFRLEYVEGVERDGIATTRVTADIDSIGYLGREASVEVDLAPPLSGPLPPASVQACESKGDYQAENPRSSASGGWQILDGTWDGYGGYARASDAPRAVQDAKAAELWAGGAGRSHWRACL